ncbi:multidrug transporter EmrE-like cation transporter [Streptomyces atratus]
MVSPRASAAASSRRPIPVAREAPRTALLRTVRRPRAHRRPTLRPAPLLLRCLLSLLCTGRDTVAVRTRERIPAGGTGRRGPGVPGQANRCVQMYATMRTLVHMGYGLLAAAIAAEVAGTTAMKYSEGFTRLWPSLITVAGYLLAFSLLAQTLKTLSMGTAYAIWAGIGTAAVATIGILFMGESGNPVKVAGIALVIAGVVVLNLGGTH